MFILIIIAVIKSAEICEKVTSHHDFKDCEIYSNNGYKTATIIMSILLGIFLLLGLLLLLWWIVRHFSNNPIFQTYGKMKDN